jgi:hypothetical protein
MDALDLIAQKRDELQTRRGQLLRDLDAITGALQILDELEKELNNVSEIPE